MNKSPAFQLYPQDFISSLDCQIMTLAEFGAFNWLLYHSWIQSPQCYLPNDIKILARLLRISNEEMDGMWENSLKKKFQVSEDKKFIYNERLLFEYNKQIDHKEKRAKAGHKGMEERWQTDSKGKVNDKQTDNKPITNSLQTDNKPITNSITKNNSSSSSSSSLSSSFSNTTNAVNNNPKVNVNQTIAQKNFLGEIEKNFILFWNTYSRKQDKKKAFEIYERILTNTKDKKGRKIIPPTPEQILLHTKQYIEQCQKDKKEMRHIKLPATFLNATDFTDEVFNIENYQNDDEGRYIPL